MLQKKITFAPKLFLSFILTICLYGSEQKKILSFQEFETKCKQAKSTNDIPFHYLGYLYQHGTIQDLKTFFEHDPTNFNRGLIRTIDQYSIAEGILHCTGQSDNDVKKTEFIKFFVTHGLNIDHSSRSIASTNLLVTALREQHDIDLPSWLLEQNANPTIRTWRGTGPITATVLGHIPPPGKLYMLKSLLEHGAQPQLEINLMTKETVLFSMIDQSKYSNQRPFVSRYLEIVAPLMVHLIDAKAEMNETALIRAVRLENPEACALLVAWGANPLEKMKIWGYKNQETKKQELFEVSAFDIAEKRPNTIIKKILDCSLHVHGYGFIADKMRELTPPQRLEIIQKNILSNDSEQAE